MTLNIKNLFNIIILLIPFQGLVLFLGSFVYCSYYSILITLLYILLILINKDRFFRFIKIMTHSSLFMIFNLLFFIILLTSVINIIMGNYNIEPIYYLHHFRMLFFGMFFIYFIPALAVYYKVGIKKILKYYVIASFSVLILGLIGYYGAEFHIGFLKSFIGLFTNKFYQTYTEIGFLQDKNRAYSVFSEPSSFAHYIFISLPIFYSISISKINLFKKQILNKITQRYLVPLAWLNLLLTKSPIFLIFCLFELLIYFHKTIFKMIKKHFFILVLSSIITFGLTLIVFSIIDLEKSYIYRIYTTITSIGSFDQLVYKEPSLATRIVGFYNSLVVFTQHTIFGVGFRNAGAYLYDAYEKSILTLTPENIQNMVTSPYNIPFSRGLIYTLLAENGIFAGIFLITFYIKNIICCLKAINKYYYYNQYNIYFGLYISLLAIIFNSFYNQFLDTPIIWFVMGLILTMSNYKKLIKGMLY